MCEERFWMVWIEGRSGPTKKHPNFPQAKNEAERLLRLPINQDRKAYILESITYAVVENPPIAWRTM